MDHLFYEFMIGDESLERSKNGTKDISKNNATLSAFDPIG